MFKPRRNACRLKYMQPSINNKQHKANALLVVYLKSCGILAKDQC